MNDDRLGQVRAAGEATGGEVAEPRPQPPPPVHIGPHALEEADWWAGLAASAARKVAALEGVVDENDRVDMDRALALGQALNRVAAYTSVAQAYAAVAQATAAAQALKPRARDHWEAVFTK